LARRLSASSRLCHQSSTRNPWTLARDTMSCPMNRSPMSGLPKGNTATNYHLRSNTQVSHHRVVNRPARIVEEDVYPLGTRVLHCGGKVSRCLVIYSRVEPDLPAPLKLVVASQYARRAKDVGAIQLRRRSSYRERLHDGGSSFSGLLTRVEIGHGPCRYCGDEAGSGAWPIMLNLAF
jgi:hypothetical protein